MAKFAPWSLQQLSTVKVNFDDSSMEHAGRAAVLAIMRTTLPAFVESVRPHVDAIMPALLSVMTSDADDIAEEAMQLFTDMNKAFRAAVEQYVPAFLDYILELAKDFERVVKARIEAGTQSRSGGKSSRRENKILRIARDSSRLLRDAPVMIVLIFQLHRRYINEYIPRFVPVVVQLLEVDVERPPNCPPDIKSVQDLGQEVCSVSRCVFNDYISSQIKVSHVKLCALISH